MAPVGANPYAEYKRTQIETASPERLILMLYDGAIKFLVQAKIKMSGDKKDPQNIEAINYSLTKAQAIVYELIKSLDMEQGGEIAENLFSLYEFMLNQLVTANIDKDPAPVSQVIGMIKDLRETWVEVINIQQKDREVQKQSYNTSKFCVAV